MSILSVQNISKTYSTIRALNDVSFDVPRGTVFGVLGPNGSGKTTLLGIVSSVLKATSGTYTLFEEEAHDDQRKKIGTLLETPNFYHYLSAVQNLKISVAIKNVSEDDISRVLKIVDLEERKDSPFSSYSLGMKQRLAIGAALLGDPEVLIFDEPTNGLDPVGIAEIRNLIKKLAGQGKTIILASHLLDEVEKVCTHVAILKKGTLIASGNVDEIFSNDSILQVRASNEEQLLKILPLLPGYVKHTINDGLIDVYADAEKMNIEDLNKYCFEHGVVLSHLQLKKSSLESKFIELTNEKK